MGESKEEWAEEWARDRILNLQAILRAAPEWQREFETWDRLDRYLHSIWWFHCEVVNGGQDQYFWNAGDPVTLATLVKALNHSLNSRAVERLKLPGGKE